MKNKLYLIKYLKYVGRAWNLPMDSYIQGTEITSFVSRPSITTDDGMFCWLLRRRCRPSFSSCSGWLVSASLVYLWSKVSRDLARLSPIRIKSWVVIWKPWNRIIYIFSYDWILMGNIKYIFLIKCVPVNSFISASVSLWVQRICTMIFFLPFQILIII